MDTDRQQAYAAAIAPLIKWLEDNVLEAGGSLTWSHSMDYTEIVVTVRNPED